RLAETLRERREDVYLFRELTTLRFDVPLEEELADLEWKGVPRERFIGFCESMGLDPADFRVDRWSD
ncbi:MAG: flap endonuclease, partial [Actinobacteria bacterium]|nr:flap endonuclease [Actinomycetota bacterium]